MRIVGGKFKGRTLHEPHRHGTHPMAEKIRGALFNVLGDINGLNVLDAFAGSGALAFEAASRGAAHVVAIEKDRAAHGIIDKNAKEFRLDKKAVHIVRANAGGWSIHNMEKKFDIVILDPPFDELQVSVLKTMAKRHVKLGGLLVLAWPGKKDIPEFDKLDVISDKNYGDAQLVFYRKTK